MTLPLAFLSPSFGEIILIAIIALLLYGSDLPQVARSWGKTYQELRRHLSGMQRDLNDVIYAEDDSPRKLQYYPEFHNETSDATDADLQASNDSPAAEAAAAPEPDAAAIAPSEPQRRDGHGAA